MPEWFTVGRIDAQTYVISEPRHWERPHCYLLEGSERSLLIDTGLGICDISVPVSELTSKHVTAALTHAHWDHIGGLWHYGDFCAHAAELSWLTGGFPLPAAAVQEMLARGYVLPEGFDTAKYELFQACAAARGRGRNRPWRPAHRGGAHPRPLARAPVLLRARARLSLHRRPRI